MRLASRVGRIAPFHVMELLARAQQLETAGRDVIHLEIGEPDFPTPEPIAAAGRRAIAAGQTRYTPACGLPALREAIAADYRVRYGVEIPARRVVVTPGASGALQLALGALIDPGDRVVMADPGYPCNRHLVELFGGDPATVAVAAADHYQLTPAHLEAVWNDRTCAVLVASPSNPTGSLLAPEALRELHRFVAARDAVLIVDEIYHGLVYDRPSTTAAALADGIVVINSFSKFFGMTGWRLGWMVVPDELARPVDKLAQNLFLAPSTPAQHAALAAFEPATLALLEQRRATFAERRDYLVPALRELGFGIPATPAGAFYVYADCSRFTGDSQRLAHDLLETQAVAVTPGIDFGRYRSGEHLRFAYTTSIERLRKAVARIAVQLQTAATEGR